MVECSERMKKYFDNIVKEVEKIYRIAEECRKLGLDPCDYVEIPLATDMAGRVEGLVGPKGVAERIRELVKEFGKEEAALKIAEEIIEGKFGKFDREKAAEQAVRTALAVLTEGIVAAPLEGIADVKIKKNHDGSEYLAIYYAGPIRSSGGTAQALSVLVGDFVRKALKLDRYKPTEDEIERYVEEVELYLSEVGSFQYTPTADEIRKAVRNIPIEITGEATDDVEVSGHRDLERVETNQLRGGALLVLVEGVLLKAPKLLKYIDKLNVEGWDWLKEFVNKEEEKEEEDEEEIEDEDINLKYWRDVNIEANKKYISEVIAGRPVFSHPSRIGGFRLRYGRARNTGFAAQGFHPALMYLVDEFIAIGTQLKTERPGKGTCAMPVDSIEGPIVRLKNGDVIRVETVEQALNVRDKVDKILFLGDVLVNYGDFLENNHPLIPSCWCEEWFEEILKSKGIKYDREFIKNPKPEDAVKFALETKTPLHPRFTYRWHDVSKEDIIKLRKWLLKGEEGYYKNEKVWIVEKSKEKEILENIGCPHLVRDNKIIIREYYPLLYSLGYDVENKRDLFNEDDVKNAKNSMHLINIMAPFEVRRNTYVYVGARMGRPEKAAPRKMKPPVNGLFPIGNAGGLVRLINKAVEENNTDSIEVSYGICKCGKISLYRVCPYCGRRVELNRYGKIVAPLKDYWFMALKRLKINKPGDVKCIKGMTSKKKIVEPLEKAILRAMHEVYVFKDGTARFDTTDVPITHFKPKEINVSVEKLKELGYDRDIYGNPLTSEDQILELKPQDIIIPEACAEYFVRVANFIDDLLEKFYNKERFYNIKKKEDLIGHLVIGLAPHTSAGMVGRIIGYVKANVCYAHPYFHAAKRRNCFTKDTRVLVNIDGDVKRVTFEELYNLFEDESYENFAYIRKKPKKDIKVYSFDIKNKKVVLTEIEEVIKAKSPNHLLKFILETGREFVTTHDHPVLVYKDNKFVEKKAIEVEEGDLILIPKIEFQEDDIKEIDLLEKLLKEEFKDLWEMVEIEGLEKWLNINKKKISLSELLKILSDYNLSIADVPKDCYLIIKDEKIKRVVDIESLLKIIGHIVKGDKSNLILRRLFKIEEGRIPSFIFKLPKERIKLFISTLFSNGRIKCKNKMLLEDIDLLLNRLGIISSWEDGELILTDKVKKLNFGWVLAVKKIEPIVSENEYIYSLNAKEHHNIIINSNINVHQCDGDEDSLFLLLDAFLNFSKLFLPDKRGGQMDAPLVLTTILDPKEVDGEVHNMDVMWRYPLEFYERTLNMPSPKELRDIMEVVEDRLGKPEQYENLGYTHETSSIDLGPKLCAYKTLNTMLEKTESQLKVAEKIRATDERDVAEKVIQSHFIPDLIGNLRAFSRQGVRCKCGAKFRRVPLRGKCPKCGSNLILTVSKGAVEKYMDVAEKMAEKYNVNNYIKQRLKLIREGIKSIFENDKNKQIKLIDFFNNYKK
ncbi:DNA polymerase II large subunit [Methanocaldococcus villosus KIN24-T80]|uniref:DNA polymerase II large subunit n=2 Tax=Methanocaldococcus villosus TaxID=667126 RepID=N6UTJ9_9EURY|nr:DNA polymerase II large subunit [Methanocaldococcus villosus KIN24-T80]